MTPAEIALIVLLSEEGAPGRYKVCINEECATYEGTAPPYAHPYQGGLRVRTPGQEWKTEAKGKDHCYSYRGSGRLITNTGHVVRRICGYEDGFALFFGEFDD